MTSTKSKATYDKETIGAFISAIVAASAFISLAADVGQLSKSTWGIIIVSIVFIITIAYLSWFIYSRLLKEKQRIENKLNKIQQLIERFITDPAHITINEKLDHDLVYRTVATKQIFTNPIAIENVHYRQDGTSTIVEIAVGCGYNHGLRDGMLFGIFHRDHMRLIQSCTCTVGYEQSTFSFTLPTNCPVSPHEMSEHSIEIKPIIPDGITVINKFLSDLLYELDSK